MPLELLEGRCKYRQMQTLHILSYHTCATSLTMISENPRAFRALLLLALTPLLVLSTQDANIGNLATVDDNIFSSDFTCREILSDADANRNGQLDRMEYVALLNRQTDQYFMEVASFDMLPLSLQANFVSLACLCEMLGEEGDCCTGDNAHLLSPVLYGDDPIDSGRPQDTDWYFEEICKDTFETVEAVITRTPSSRPTSSSMDSLSPSKPVELVDNITDPDLMMIPSTAPSTIITSPSIQPSANAFATGTIADLQISGIASAQTPVDVPATNIPWRKENRKFFIPMLALSFGIVVALSFSLYLVLRHKYKRDMNGFVLGSFPGPQLTNTITITDDWRGNGFVANSLDDQFSYEYSGYESDTGSRVSLRSIHVPLWFSRPYSHYRYAAYHDTEFCDVDENRVSPMSSEQGSDQGSIKGSCNSAPFP